MPSNIPWLTPEVIRERQRALNQSQDAEPDARAFWWTVAGFTLAAAILAALALFT